MALIVTPGAANANSYASLAEAIVYFSFRLSADTWNDASELEKEAALVMAARLLDAMPGAWTGAATNEDQSLGWPRTGMYNRNGFAIGTSVIPQALKDAQCEFGMKLIAEDRLGDNDVMNQRLTQVKAGPVEVSFDHKENETGGVVTDQPTAELAGRLIVPDVVRVMLVPSWLLPTADQQIAQNKSTLIFEILV